MTETKKDNTKVAQMLTHLGRSAEELKASDAWKAMLKVQARFHRYSASNMLMIWLQRPEATRVAGFRQWQGMGRQVQRGEKAIKIFAPMTKKNDDTGERKLLGFKMVSVFDISQTEGEPLPMVEWPEAQSCPPGLLEQVTTRAEALGFTVRRDVEPSPFAPGARGWFEVAEKRINLTAQSEAGMVATLLHELGHALDPMLTEDIDRARKELVAESVSYVLGLQLGVDLHDETEHYIASWGGSVDDLLGVMDRVRAALNVYDSIEDERVAA